MLLEGLDCLNELDCFRESMELCSLSLRSVIFWANLWSILSSIFLKKEDGLASLEASREFSRDFFLRVLRPVDL